MITPIGDKRLLLVIYKIPSWKRVYGLEIIVSGTTYTAGASFRGVFVASLLDVGLVQVNHPNFADSRNEDALISNFYLPVMLFIWELYLLCFYLVVLCLRLGLYFLKVPASSGCSGSSLLRFSFLM